MIGSLFEGKYRIVRLIGEGGMGAVYEAEHTLIGRQLAIKLLHPEYANQADIVQRFTREARAATAIRHANIIEVTDMGVTPTGQPFLVMELLEGTSLRRLVEPGKTMAQARLLDVMQQVLDALHAAHDRGIVHRDLKPDNIFLIRHAGRDDFVKVLDFGISKFLGPFGGVSSNTRTGSVLGTPQYMSPEQAMGRKDIDHRADLWAVGVMLYEASTGRPPYAGDNYNEVLAGILMNTPPPPRMVYPGVSPALEQVIVKALTRTLEQRYQTAVEFRNALLALQPDAAAVAPPAHRTDVGVSPPPAAALPVVTPTPYRSDLIRERWPALLSTRPSESPDVATTERPLPATARTFTPGAHELPSDFPPPRSRRPWYIASGVTVVALAGVVLFLALRPGGGDKSGTGVASPAIEQPATTTEAPVAAPLVPAVVSPPAAPPVVTTPATTTPSTASPTTTPVAVTPVVPPTPAPPVSTPAPPPVAAPSPPAQRPRDAAVRTPPTTRDASGSPAVAVRPADAGSRPPVDARTVAPPVAPAASPDAGSSAAARDAGRRDARSLMTQYEEPVAAPRDAGRPSLQADYQ